MQAVEQAKAQPGRSVLLFQDEASFYRQPSQAWLWAWMGRRQPRVRYGHRANTRMRLVGFLEAVSGQVLTWDLDRVSAKRLAWCVRQVSAAFPRAERIVLVWDNWPVHQHPTVLEALAEDPRLQLLPLPTYAPWLNPIEKLWRLVRQEVTHAHPWCEDFPHFRTTVMAKLEEFAHGSPRLLRYCGLSS